MISNWVDMKAATQNARNEKARQLRLCRHYLSRAKKQGLSEKSTTIRYWRMMLAEWRAEPIESIAGGENFRLWRRKRDRTHDT